MQEVMSLTSWCSPQVQGGPLLGDNVGSQRQFAKFAYLKGPGKGKVGKISKRALAAHPNRCACQSVIQVLPNSGKPYRRYCHPLASLSKD